MFGRNRYIGLACLFCLWLGGGAAQAATWQEEREAGFNAFNNADYMEAVELFESALTLAHEEQAGDRELGVILENLTTAYFAVQFFRPARDTVARWDQILARSTGETWAAEQRVVRDRLAVLISEVLGESLPEISSSQLAPASEPAGEPAAETAGGSVAESSVDSAEQAPAPSDQTQSEQPEVKQTAALAPGSYAVHLVSLKDQEGAERSWNRLTDAYPSLLSDKSPEVRQVDLGEEGTFYRLYAAPYADRGEAEEACAELERLEQYCAVATLK